MKKWMVITVLAVVMLVLTGCILEPDTITSSADLYDIIEDEVKTYPEEIGHKAFLDERR